MKGLILDSVVKLVDGKRVLDGVSLSIRPKEILAIIGASGTGKSTLLRTINRLTEIDGGHISLDGSPIHHIDPIELRRRIGMVFQLPALFDGTVGANVRYGLELQGISSPERITGAMRAADLPIGCLERDASKLSVGEQQRVSIARALALEPEVLLLDEPTASLDGASTKRIESTIQKLLNKKGLMIIWVTHDRIQAKRVGTRIGLLKDGRIKTIDNRERGWI